MCGECGNYRGRVVVDVVAKLEKKLKKREGRMGVAPEEAETKEETTKPKAAKAKKETRKVEKNVAKKPTAKKKTKI